MPALDRRITLQRNHGMPNEGGEFVNDWRDVGRLWATRIDLTETDRVNAGGAVTVATVRYLIRWRSDVAGVDPAVLRIIDGADTLSVTGIQESDDRGPLRERRRMMRLEATGATE